MILKLDRHYSLLTPAKINLFLKILNRRPDGYHELDMDMVPITLSDKLVLIPASNELWQANQSPAGKIIKRCFSLLAEEFKLHCFLDFRLEKQIPHEAGLGGSSGNVGGLLFLIKKLLAPYRGDFPTLTIARLIGSDVPFFLQPQAALIAGVGEKITPCRKHKPLALLIFKPDFGISTKTAFASYEARPEPDWRFSDYRDIATWPPEVNSFWQPRLPRFQQLKAHREAILSLPLVTNVLLSGSGSALTVIFNSNAERDLFFKNYSKLIGGGTFYRANSLLQFEYKITSY